MPSVNQQRAKDSWVRTDLGNRLMSEHDEDIERFLYGGGFELALARIAGITDRDLLAAYTKIEAERERRQEVFAAINQRAEALEEAAVDD